MADTAPSQRPISATLPPGQPLHVRILGTYLLVTDLPETLRTRLADLVRPFVLANDDTADDTADAQDAPAITFSVAWDEIERLWKIYGDGQFLNGMPDEDAVLLQLEWRMVVAGMNHAEGCGIFHAGVLTRGEATVLIQGESGAGKTTLTLGLIARGWLPLSDDAAIVDARTLGLRVFPRCFHVEHPDERPPEARPHLEPVAAVEGHARPLSWGAEGRRPTAIITVVRDPKQPSSLTPLLRAQAAGALLAGSIRTRMNGSQVADLAARVAASVRYCGRLNNSDLSTALDLIEEACSR